MTKQPSYRRAETRLLDYLETIFKVYIQGLAIF